MKGVEAQFETAVTDQLLLKAAPLLLCKSKRIGCYYEIPILQDDPVAVKE